MTNNPLANIGLDRPQLTAMASGENYRAARAVAVVAALPRSLDHALLTLEDAKRLILFLHHDLAKADAHEVQSEAE